MIKVCSFFIIISFIFTPFVTEASWISDIFGGEQVQASDEIPASDTNSDDNSQNIDLDINTEPSVNPDLKSTKGLEDIIIVQNDSFISSEGSFIPDVKFEKSKLSDQIRVYTVEKGDTLSEIAETFGVSMNTIRWENNISGQTISVGQKLNILPMTGVKHIVKSGDTVNKIADKYEAETEDALVFNGIEKNEGLKKGDIIFVPNGIIKPVVVVKPASTSKIVTSNTKVPTGYYLRPVSGRVTSPYGSRRGGFHPGVDLGGVRGTPVMAAADGVVSKVIRGCVEGKKSCGGRYGNHIVIEHPNGTNTTYAHLSKTSVSVGQTVFQGDTIGLLGNTGQSTGPHLHFEVENANGSKMRPPF